MDHAQAQAQNRSRAVSAYCKQILRRNITKISHNQVKFNMGAH